MNFEYPQVNPFKAQISFHKVIEALEEIALSDVDYRSQYAKGLLREVEKVPELRTGITDFAIVTEHKRLIRNLLADLFPTALTKNEIKAVTIPFQSITFNYSERFQHILNNAGPDFDMNIRDFDDHAFYVVGCCIILNAYYGCNIEFSKPFFYDIPDAKGIMHHYRILYNADFLEIYPTEKAVPITQEDIDMLLDNYDDFELWKSKFPVESYLLKGFGIMNLYDNTVESAISTLKSSLLGSEEAKKEFLEEQHLQGIFRSIYKIPDLRVGFIEFKADEAKFGLGDFPNGIPAFSLIKLPDGSCPDSNCTTLTAVGASKDTLVISDVKKYLDEHPDQKYFAENLLAQGIRSCILTPLVKNDKLLAIIELVSATPKALNSINVNKLEFITPFITDTVDRYYSDFENQIDAIIQKEYTAIHPSVYWKFRKEAALHAGPNGNKELPFKEIIFREVYPLYGQIDIKGSSEARNSAISKDLTLQIDLLLSLFGQLTANVSLPVIQQQVFELEKFRDQLEGVLKADTESIIQNYIQEEIHPVLTHFEKTSPVIEKAVAAYHAALDPAIHMIYDSRKDFDKTLSVINKKMATLLDKKQETAQEFFPHYYERFKTDGVEHNLYIGASIAPKLAYTPIYLNNLRLWQLQASCEMENEYFNLRKTLPYDLDVTSLILVFSSPISIRFRMDEKRFDVDGTYNARYEVVKKRIDKSRIKGTNERIAEQGKITIVYSQQHEEKEYKKYIQLLQHENKLAKEIEKFEVEDLQGVTGLKALRVAVIYSENATDDNYSFAQLLAESGEN